MEINSEKSDEFHLKKSAKKRKADPCFWKRNIKVARIKGEEFFNYQGNTVPQKYTSLPCK